MHDQMQHIIHLVEANADLGEHAGLQLFVVVALHRGIDAASQALLNRGGYFFEVVCVSWNRTGGH